MKECCDGCGKERTDIRSCGRDSNGDPDAPDLCFICRKEGERGRRYNSQLEGYLSSTIDIEEVRFP